MLFHYADAILMELSDKACHTVERGAGRNPPRLVALKFRRTHTSWDN